MAEEERFSLRGVVVQDQEDFAMFVWWACELDFMEAQLDVADPAHMLDTPLPGQGLWVWEGALVGENLRGEGAYRPLTDEEWARVRAGQTPLEGVD
jgi:hypothetical protein